MFGAMIEEACLWSKPSCNAFYSTFCRLIIMVNLINEYLLEDILSTVSSFHHGTSCKLLQVIGMC